MRTLDDLLARQQAARAAPAVPRPVLAGGDAAGRAALSSECERVASTPEGGRDHALNTAAYRMGQLVSGGHLELETVVERLAEAGLASGQSPAEVGRALRPDANGGLAQGMANPRQLEPSSAATVAYRAWNPPEPTSEELGAAALEAFPSIDWRAVWEEDAGEDWIVEPVIPARRLIALYSPPKVGKSLLALELAAAIAAGGTALGAQITTRRTVLYVDFENDIRGDVVPRLRAYGYGPEDLDRLRYLSFPSLSALDTPAGGEQLLQAAVAYRAELVVIDTISRAVQGEENQNDTWLAFYRLTGARLKAAGIAVLRLDHSGKDAEKGMRGGSAKYSDVDAVWQLSEVEPDRTFRLLCTDNRFPIVEKELIIKRVTSPKLIHRVDPEGSYGVYRDKLAATVAKLDELGIDAGASTRECSDALREIDAGVRQAIVVAAAKLRRTRLEDDEK